MDCQMLSTSLAVILLSNIITSQGETLIIGVLAPQNSSKPWCVEEILPAIQIAIEVVMNDTNLLPNHTIDLKVRNTGCSTRTAPVAAIELYKHTQPHAFFGPMCDYALASVASYSAYWNIPVLTAGGLAEDFKNKNIFSLLTRMSGSYADLANFFVTLVGSFGWNTVGLFMLRYRRAVFTNQACHIAMSAIYRITKLRMIKVWHFNMPKVDNDKIFQQIQTKARVVLMCAEADAVRDIMIGAHERNFDTGDYVFINLELFTAKEKLKTPWYRETDTLDNNNKARKAFEALMTIAIRNPRDDQYRAFSQEVKRRSRMIYPDFVFDDDEVSSFAGAMHDGMILYATAVTEALKDGGNVSNGADINRRMWNRTFDGITGPVKINSNGDRNMDFYLMDMIPSTGNFEVVGHFFGSTQRYEPVPGKMIYWAGGRTSPPPDSPQCGFKGEKCGRTPTEIPNPTKCTADTVCLNDRSLLTSKFHVVSAVLGCVLFTVFAGIVINFRHKILNLYYRARRGRS